MIDSNTEAIVQGITGREGSRRTELMLRYGTKILAGVTPYKGGIEIHRLPVYDTVREAVNDFPQVKASIILVPNLYAKDAVFEAIEAGIELIIVITEHIPIADSIKFVNYAKWKGCTIIGPNSPGIISPGKCMLGVMPAHFYKIGNVGIVSRSGTLSYEIARSISNAGLGQSTCIGIGGDPIIGMKFVDAVKLLEDDPETKAIAIVGEIGGNMEESLAHYVRKSCVQKPMVTFIAGRTAPPGKRMGHAGAIITMGEGTAESKIKAFEDAGITVATTPCEVAETLLEIL